MNHDPITSRGSESFSSQDLAPQHNNASSPPSPPSTLGQVYRTARNLSPLAATATGVLLATTSAKAAFAGIAFLAAASGPIGWALLAAAALTVALIAVTLTLQEKSAEVPSFMKDYGFDKPLANLANLFSSGLKLRPIVSSKVEAEKVTPDFEKKVARDFKKLSDMLPENQRNEQGLAICKQLFQGGLDATDEDNEHKRQAIIDSVGSLEPNTRGEVFKQAASLSGIQDVHVRTNIITLFGMINEEERNDPTTVKAYTNLLEGIDNTTLMREDIIKLFGMLPENERTLENFKACKDLLAEPQGTVPLENKVVRMNLIRLFGKLPENERTLENLKVCKNLLAEEKNPEPPLLDLFEMLPENKRTLANFEACKKKLAQMKSTEDGITDDEVRSDFVDGIKDFEPEQRSKSILGSIEEFLKKKDS